VVADLFAGSGALGIEALSRGAASATFVDRDGAAVATIRANLAVLGEAAGRATVVRDDVMRWLGSVPEPGDVPADGAAAVPAHVPVDVIDLALADPPYDFGDWPALLDRLRGRAGLVVAESAAELGISPGWGAVKVKRYGGTVVTIMQPDIRFETREKHPRAQQEGET
jgi:16S rRNA (guanine966-N2)-methyltransferase